MGRTLSDLSPPAGAKRPRKRVGRGPGSGNGTTAGRGQKGQRSRSGGRMGPWFEGGQMPLQRRLPKRGFRSLFRVAYAPVNVSDLAKAFGAGEVVDLAGVKGKGLVPRRAERWKVLGHGDIGLALTVQAHACSASARQKLEGAGGSVAVLGPKVARGAAEARIERDK